MDPHIVEDEISSEEHSGHAWLHGWENELGPYSAVSVEHQNELKSLVEDKEIASRAVAFVVNSTRKGIVPLCADVASLLRAKRSLEKKVSMLKKENEILRSSSSLSRNSSHSISPTPNSQSSDKSTQPDYTLSALQERIRPCSRCSQCSSTISNSPKIDTNHRQRLTSLQHSPASSQGDDEIIRRHSSPHDRRSRSKNRNVPDVRLTHAVVHVNPQSGDADFDRSAFSNPQNNFKSLTGLKLNQNGELKPLRTAKIRSSSKIAEDEFEYLEEGASHVQKLSHRIPSSDVNEGDVCNDSVSDQISSDQMQQSVNTIPVCHSSMENCRELTNDAVETIHSSKEERCMFSNNDVFLPDVNMVTVDKDHLADDTESSTKLHETIKSDDFSSINKDMEDLRRRLAQLQTKQAESHQLFIENECTASKKGTKDSKSKTMNNNNIKNLNYEVKPKNSPRITPISAFRPHFLPDCKCTSCSDSKKYSKYGTSGKSDDSSKEKKRFSVSHKLQIQVGDHIVAKGDKTGHVRYIGHLDHSPQSHMLYVGLELDSTAGNHDGCVFGKRYFSCEQKRGVFVPLQEVMCKVAKKVSKSKEENGIAFKKKRPPLDRTIPKS